MKILIVDDEPIIRDSLCHVIENSSLGIHTVLSTSDSQKALTILNQEQPEILLSDIQMPKVTGIDLARHVFEQKLPTKVIFITGYSDFEYARAGIEYRVADYLLKPVDEKEAVDCIRRVLQSHTKDIRHAEMYKLFQSYFSTHFDAVRRQFLERLLFYPLTLTPQELLLQQKEMKLDCSVFLLGAITFQSAPPHTSEEFYYIYMIEQCLNDNFKTVVTLPFGSTLYLVWPLADKGQDETSVYPLAMKIRECIRNQYPIRIMIGFSRLASDFLYMQQLRRQASQSLDYANVHQDQDIVFYDELPGCGADEQYFDAQSAITELVACLRSGDSVCAERLLTPVMEKLAAQPSESAENTIHFFVSHILYFINGISLPPGEQSKIKGTVETQINAQSNIALRIEYFRYWITYICNCISGLRENEQNTLIEGVYDYINRFYSQPIGLTNVSEFINRNPSYVSRLIKQHTERNFSQILTEKRMEEAKKLLRDPSLKLADIAAQTGYPNLRYFTRVFHTQVNMSPNDYRKIITTFR